MGDFERINLVQHAKKSLFAGRISVEDFETVAEECAKGTLQIIADKIKLTAKCVIEDFKNRTRIDDGYRIVAAQLAHERKLKEDQYAFYD